VKWIRFYTEVKPEIRPNPKGTGATIAMRCPIITIMWAATGKSVHDATIN
jgi:hypothetical protein